MSDVVVDVRHLARHFGDLVAVSDVSFQIEKASIFGLLGPNGSGKSTIIRMLLGILEPTAGQATVLGHDVRSESELIKRRVGYMSQQFSLYADLSVIENIEFYGRIYGLHGSRLAERCAAVLELAALEHRRFQLAGTLSGGWKQRLALACSLIHEPELLFLDEPTAGIDPVARRQLWDLLFQLAGRGVTLLVTTHYMDEAERCTDVGYIHMSKLLVCGKPGQLKQLPAVTPAGTRRYELRVRNPAIFLAEFRGAPCVQDATLFGETLHLLVTDACSPASLLGTLREKGESDAEIREIPPSLEDVFVTLTRDAERTLSQGTSLAAPPLAAGPESGPRPEVPLSGHDVNVADPPAAKRRRAAKSRPRVRKVGRTTDGLFAIMVKEFAHIRRQPSTLFFMLVVPVMQTIIFGWAIDTQIEHIPLVVLDHDGRADGRRLVEAFVNTERFELWSRVHDEESFRRALTSGHARVGLRIPPDYSDRLLSGEQVTVQVLIDGSDSQVATTALTTAKLLGVNLSIYFARARGEAAHFAPSRTATGDLALPIDVRPRLLYNPDLESAFFFVPGLIGIILQLVTLFLTSFAVVRERELGTLEQLFVTPVGRTGLLLGKLLPYALVGFIELLIVLLVMVYVFGVPIHGSIFLLLTLSMLFMVCSLGLGLLVSTVTKTQLGAVQAAFVIMLPSVLLSGFVFPRAEMPTVIYVATFGIPVTYFIEILRGIVLRGADIRDLLPWVAGLAACGFVILTLAITRFRKQLA